MKLSKAIVWMCLGIGILRSQTGFGTEVGNYWVVNNNLVYRGGPVQVEYDLSDWRGRRNGELAPGSNDGTKPPYIYSSFPGSSWKCTLQSPETNLLRVYTPVSRTPICDFRVTAKVQGSWLCEDPTIIEPISYMDSVTCKHIQKAHVSRGDTIYTEISVDGLIPGL
jgi:hypothetical protein